MYIIRACTLLPEFSLIYLGVPLTSFKLAIARQFFRDANLSWFNEERRCTARLTWPSMDRKRTNLLLGLVRNIISITVAMLTGYCVMDRHAERIRLKFNTSVVDARPLRKRWLLSTFFINALLLQGACNQFGFGLILKSNDPLSISGNSYSASTSIFSCGSFQKWTKELFF